jgi:hypothetical protein
VSVENVLQVASGRISKALLWLRTRAQVRTVKGSSGQTRTVQEQISTGQVSTGQVWSGLVWLIRSAAVTTPSALVWLIR